MAIFKCKMCGGTLEINNGESIATCEYCGAKQTLPTAKDENIQGLFNRANILRMKCEFDKAEQLYEKIVQADQVYFHKLNSKDFGIPQNRPRAFIVMIRSDLNVDFRQN